MRKNPGRKKASIVTPDMIDRMRELAPTHKQIAIGDKLGLSTSTVARAMRAHKIAPFQVHRLLEVYRQ